MLPYEHAAFTMQHHVAPYDKVAHPQGGPQQMQNLHILFFLK